MNYNNSLYFSVLCSIINVLYTKNRDVVLTNFISIIITLYICCNHKKNHNLVYLYPFTKINTLYTIYKEHKNFLGCLNLFSLSYLLFCTFNYKSKLCYSQV